MHFFKSKVLAKLKTIICRFKSHENAPFQCKLPNFFKVDLINLENVIVTQLRNSCIHTYQTKVSSKDRDDG